MKILSMMKGHQLVLAERKEILVNQLEGWDFMDIANSGTALLRPRMSKIENDCQAWLQVLSDICAVPLFGQNFGNIFQPRENNDCDHWRIVPNGHYYLTAHFQDLEQIMKNHGNPSSCPKKLTFNTIWNIRESSFLGCQCKKSTEPSHIVQNLALKDDDKPPEITGQFLGGLPSPGAVVFGGEDPRSVLMKSSQSIALVAQPSSTASTDRRDPFDSEPQEPVIMRTTPSVSSVQGTKIPLFRSPIVRGYRDYRIAIICALPQELQAVPILFDERHEQIKYNSNDHNSYTFGRIAKHNVVVACLPKGQYGNCAAAILATHLKQSFPEVRFALLVGIGGAIPSKEHDIRLGDVVVSVTGHGYPGVIKYDFHKTLQGELSQPLGTTHLPPAILTSLMSRLQGDPRLVDPLQPFLSDVIKLKPDYASPGPQCNKLFITTYRHVPGQRSCVRCNGRVVQRKYRQGTLPKIHYGLIATEDQVIKDAE